jgi:ligand-binding sensor domain-containing protein/signal transduction histidine kinase
MMSLKATSGGESLPRQLHFQRLSIEDGLSQSTVFGIAQDQEGFLWFGSEAGLNKYDGYRFTQFLHEDGDESSIGDNWVRCLQVDGAGRLWIGTRLGLDMKMPGSSVFQHVIPAEFWEGRRDLGGFAVLALDEQGTVWAGSFSSGLCAVKSDLSTQWFHSGDDSGLHDDRMRVLLASGQDLWIGTKVGLYRMDLASRTIRQAVMPSQEGLSHAEIRALARQGKDYLWVGTTHGLNRLHLASGTWQTYLASGEPGSLSDNWINTVLADEKGRLWIGTRNGGLNVLEAGADTFLNYRHDPFLINSLSTDNIIAIFQDRSGVLWMGGYLSGVNKLTLLRKEFALYRNHPLDPGSILHNTVRSILLDRQQRLWVGTLEGLTVLGRDRQAIGHFVHEPGAELSLSESQILAIAEDAAGDIWLGTYGGGINIIKSDLSSLEVLNTGMNVGLGDDFPQALLRDSQGRMWVGGRSGILLFDPANRQFAPLEPARRAYDDFGRLSVLALYEDRLGRLWAGTYGRGAWCTAGQDLTILTHHKEDPRSLSHDFVTSFAEDGQGRLWIGTLDGICLLHDDMSLTRFKTRDGLPNHYIQGLQADEEGHLWASSNRGIFQLRTDSLPELRVQAFDTPDGLQGGEFVGGASHRGAGGELFFGGLNGLNAFFPGRIETNPSKHRLALTSFTIFNEVHELLRQADGKYRPLNLKHDENTLSFEFAALDVANPEKVRYAYQLEGVDAAWVYAGSRRYASYSNLPGGRFAFLLKATNADGSWSETPLRLGIEITPPFWKRSWFLLICILSLALIVHLRLRELSRTKQLLEARVRERTQAYEAANQELVRTQHLLVDAAHQAGMAEIAVDVLHNIGNALNSMMVSSDLMQEKLEAPKVAELLRRLAGNLQKGEMNLADMAERARLVESLGKIATFEERIWGELREESRLLGDKTLHIQDIVRAQQDHAMRSTFVEEISLADLVNDALKIQSGSLRRHGVQVAVQVPPIVVKVAKSKLIQVLVNLIKNGIEATKQGAPEQARITISVRELPGQIQLVLEDNGIGIAQDKLQRIFNYGFSDKPKGRGFGLHFCANAMTEMNGRIQVQSEGPGKGCTFTLEFPLEPQDLLPA